MARRRYWLMKSEPDVFSFEDLLAAKGKTTHWDGVRNYQARNFMRDGMKPETRCCSIIQVVKSRA